MKKLNYAKIIAMSFIISAIFFMADFACAVNDTEKIQPAGVGSELLRVYKNKKGTSIYVFKNDVKWYGAGSFTKSLNVGTTKNKGILYIRGVIKNPNKGKKVVINDNVTVKGNLKVDGGILQGSGIISSSNLSDGAITAAKIAQNAVSSDKILDGAILSEKIADNTIAGNDISPTAQLSVASLSASGSVIIGGGDAINKHISWSDVTSAITMIGTSFCTTVDITKSGISVGERIVAVPVPTTDGIEDDDYNWNAYISADDTVTIKICRPDSGVVGTIAAQTWYFDVWQ